MNVHGVAAGCAVDVVGLGVVIASGSQGVVAVLAVLVCAFGVATLSSTAANALPPRGAAMGESATTVGGNALTIGFTTDGDAPSMPRYLEAHLN